MLEPCCRCIDRGEGCEEPLAGSKGTACNRCARLHITCKRVQSNEDEEEEKEEVVEQRKRMRPEVVIPVLGPSRAVIQLQLDNSMWVLIEQMSEHLGTITHEVKQIVDDVKEVQDSRRVKVRPQAGVQMEEKEMAEAGVEAEEGGEKGSEDRDKTEKERRRQRSR